MVSYYRAFALKSEAVNYMDYCATLSHASTITVEAITMIQTRKNGTNLWVLYSLFIVIIALEPFFSDSQAL